MQGGIVLKTKDADTLVTAGEYTQVFRKTLGEGELWYFTDDSAVINRNIDKEDNLRLLYQIAARAKTIMFDEFHHGYTVPIGAEFKTRQDAAILLIVVLAVLLVAFALVRAVRFGPPLPVAVPDHAATAEFASVLGLLYREHNAAEVLGNYLEAWKKRIEQTFGISHRLSGAEIVSELAERRLLRGEKQQNVAAAMRRLLKPEGSASTSLEWSVNQLESVFTGAI